MRWPYLLLPLFSCGKGYEINEERQEEIAESQYHAQLKPLNTRMGIHQGWVEISVSDNQFWARIKFKGRMSKNGHPQHIHLTHRCPTSADDLNRDGILDFKEALVASGPILLPLDGNLNSQVKGMSDFPKMRRKESSYYYSEASNVDRMMNDLRGRDVIQDNIVKLKSDEELALQKRVVIIYGIDQDISLPVSVSSQHGYSPQHSLPVACGKIQDGPSEEFEREN